MIIEYDKLLELLDDRMGIYNMVEDRSYDFALDVDAADEEAFLRVLDGQDGDVIWSFNKGDNQTCTIIGTTLRMRSTDGQDIIFCPLDVFDIGKWVERQLGFEPDTAITDLHPAIVRLATDMQHKLDDKKARTEQNPEDGEPGEWRDKDSAFLLRRLRQELDEFTDAMRHSHYRDAQLELADVANFAMMLHDKLSELRGMHTIGGEYVKVGEPSKTINMAKGTTSVRMYALSEPFIKLMIPKGSRVLSLSTIKGVPYPYLNVERTTHSDIHEERVFRTASTDQEIFEQNKTFIGSVRIAEATLHVFEVKALP